jgi:hypothetical protein
MLLWLCTNINVSNSVERAKALVEMGTITIDIRFIC